MDPLDLFFRAVGLFYLGGSYIGLRAVLMDSVLDKALAALSASGADRKEEGRRLIVGAFTVAFGTGGAALVLMNELALPIFVINLAAQAIWLFWARNLFIESEDDDAASVRQLRNSSLIYAAATFGVCGLWQDGRLGTWDDPLAAALVAATAIGLGGWFFYHLWWRAGSSSSDGIPGVGEYARQPTPRRVVIDPVRWMLPLIDAETGERFNHLRVFDNDLGWRVEHWNDDFQDTFDPDDEMAAEALFASAEAERDYRAEAEAIRRELAALLGDTNVSFGPNWRGKDSAGA